MRGTRASVVNSSNGGTPGGMMRSNTACSSAGYGGLTGSLRGEVIVVWILPELVSDGATITVVKNLQLRKQKSSRRGAARRTMPTPGSPVRGSRTGRPIMALLDLLGRRWLLRITWELRAQLAGFRQLQLRCDDMSPSVLSQRPHEVQAAEVLELLGARAALLHFNLRTYLLVELLVVVRDRFMKSSSWVKDFREPGETARLERRGRRGAVGPAAIRALNARIRLFQVSRTAAPYCSQNVLKASCSAPTLGNPRAAAAA